jgi:uncharacterized membrane protein
MAQAAEFRHRAHEVSRIEAFSDVIFGFAISLLVVSLEAPKSYAEMMEMLRGFVPFAISFFILIDIWFEHHDFFKRYALQDRTTMFLNTALLFVVLFYVYPLKFMFSRLAMQLRGEHADLPTGGTSTLFTVYGLGVFAVFGILAMMFGHAYRKRDELDLNGYERIDTRASIYDNASMAAFGLLSLILAHTQLIGLAGFVYFLIAIPKTIIPTVMRTKRRQYEMVTSPTTSAST